MSDPQETAANQTSWAHSLPAIVAIALGGIYALGALNIYGQLNSADVSPQHGLSHFPIDQILARGMASLISPIVLLAVLFMVLLGVFSVLEMGIAKFGGGYGLRFKGLGDRGKLIVRPHR